MPSKNHNTTETAIRGFNASVVGQVVVPIYQGGAEYALIRQAKETVGQRRLELALNSRSGPRQRRPVMGPARCRQGADRGDQVAGDARPRLRSTVCVKKHASASAPRSTC